MNFKIYQIYPNLPICLFIPNYEESSRGLFKKPLTPDQNHGKIFVKHLLHSNDLSTFKHPLSSWDDRNAWIDLLNFCLNISTIKQCICQWHCLDQVRNQRFYRAGVEIRKRARFQIVSMWSCCLRNQGVPRTSSLVKAFRWIEFQNSQSFSN